MRLIPRQMGDPEDSRMMDAIDRLVSVSRRHWKPLAVVTCKVAITSNEWLKDFQLLMLTSDYSSIVKGHKEELMQMTKTIAELLGLRN